MKQEQLPLQMIEHQIKNIVLSNPSSFGTDAHIEILSEIAPPISMKLVPKHVRSSFVDGTRDMLKIRGIWSDL